MDYLALARKVVSDATAEGREVEVIITEGKQTTIRVEGQKVEQLLQSGTHGMGVRVLINGQTGYAYTSDLGNDSVRETWQSAVELAKVSTPDDFRKLPEPQTIPDDDLGIFDPEFSERSVDEKIQFAMTMEKAALDYDDAIFLTNRCQYADEIETTYLANSKGFAGSYSKTTCFGFLAAIARGEDGGMVNAYGFGASVFFKDLDPVAIGETAGRKTMSILGGKPVPSKTVPVVLDHFVGAQILGAISQALSAEQWQKKRSFLLDRMGQEIGSSMVTLMDNGKLEGGLASAPFDGEGVPTQATRLVDEGVLQNLMYDSYTAAKEGVISTGNAQRNGHRGLPGLAPSNFYMQPGLKTPDEIIAGIDEGFYVISVMQTGGIDPITGDCSMSANGLWIENGKTTKAVGGVTIATTLDGFLQNITEVGSDLQQLPFFGSLGVPTLRVDNVMVGGKD